MDRKVIGSRLRELRGDTPLHVVAKELGVSISTVSMWENGERLPKDEFKISLASYYKTTVEALFYAQ